MLNIFFFFSLELIYYILKFIGEIHLLVILMYRRIIENIKSPHLVPINEAFILNYANFVFLLVVLVAIMHVRVLLRLI